MTVKIAPDARQQFFDAQGNILSGGKLFTYAAGSTTKLSTYTTSAGSVANSNPIVLDSAGRTPSGVWLTAGLTYKFVLTTSGDTDPPASPIWTEDNISGVNDASLTIDQWIASGLTPTYVSATSFTLTGDQTSAFHVGRRLKTTNSGGTVYGRITASVYGALTTVTVVNDSGVLDAGLSAVSYGILSNNVLSLPARIATAAGTDTYTATVGALAYVTGDEYRIKIANANTATTPTLNLDSLGAKTIVQQAGTAMAAGQLNGEHTFRYNGTNMVVLNPLPVVTNYPNRLVNGNFQIDQRVNSATTRADDAYCLDRWYVLTQTGTITVTQQTLQEDGTPFNIRLTQAQASAQRMGLAQILEAKDSQDLRAKVTAMAARVRISNSQALRYAILEWTGTADSVTSDVVNDWTSSTYTAGNFFLAANLTVSAVGSMTPSAATWTDLTELSATLGSSGNNLIVFVWTEGTAAQNVTLDIARARFGQGATAPAVQVPNYGDELRRCQRFYWKSFAMATAPAQSAGTTNAITTRSRNGTGAGGVGTIVAFPGRMFAAPSVTTYNPSAANANWRQSGGSDSAVVVDNISDWGVSLENNDAVTFNIKCQIHVTAEAEL